LKKIIKVSSAVGERGGENKVLSLRYKKNKMANSYKMGVLGGQRGALTGTSERGEKWEEVGGGEARRKAWGGLLGGSPSEGKSEGR